jgi:hypothetical protein
MSQSETAHHVHKFTSSFLHKVGIPADSVVTRFENVLHGVTVRIDDRKATTLQSNPNVKKVVQDRLFKAINPIAVSSHPAKPLTSQTIPWDIPRVNGPFNGIGKTAWILDTGIDLDHPDLNVDVNQSASFIATESANDLNGHGTHVAGILAAKDNNIDVVGVAAGATVVAVKVLDQNGFASNNSICAGLEYVTHHASASDIINMSIETYPDSVHTMNQCVRNAANMGFRIVAAAGNYSESAYLSSPGSVENPNVWTVSAFKQGDIFATSFSNYGNPPIEYSEPGVNVLSLWKNGGTHRLSGTSMATPILAGLLLAAPQGIETDGHVSNDPDGNPDPIAVGKLPPPSLSVSIYGPLEVYPGDQPIWTAHPHDGAPPYQYSWYWKKLNRDTQIWTNWAPAPAGDIQSWGYSYNPDLAAMQLKIKVKDADNATATNKYPEIAFAPPCYPFCGQTADSTLTDSTAHHATKMK